jgi:cytochrome c553
MVLKRYKYIVILLILLTALPVMAAALIASQPIAPSSYGLQFPHDYRTTFTHYLTVERPDGTIRRLYINPIGLNAARNNTILPDGTVIVIEGNYALRNADGEYILDQQGHFVPGDPFPAIHVREKRSFWRSEDFASPARNGNWNYASFDPNTQQTYEESINACFNCHAPAGPDHLYSYPSLQQVAQTGTPLVIQCTATGRTPCE